MGRVVSDRRVCSVLATMDAFHAMFRTFDQIAQHAFGRERIKARKARGETQAASYT